MTWFSLSWTVLLGLATVGCIITACGVSWMRWWHGEGEEHQYQVYRCHGCRRLVSHHRIRTGGCPCHESTKVSPARLTVSEKVRMLYLPWTVTSLKTRRESIRRTHLAAAL